MKSNELSETALWNKSTFSLENVMLPELSRSVKKKKKEQNAPLEQNKWAFLKWRSQGRKFKNRREFIQIWVAVVAAR